MQQVIHKDGRETMERGAPFSHIHQPKSNSGMKLEQQQSNPNPMTNSGSSSGASDRNKGPVVQQQPCTVREQDQYMPIANVIRIMRTILPTHAKISDDAKETIQECVSEFISFVTGEANERCQHEQRKTITADDILWAMTKLGFDNYVGPLTTFITRYREMESDRGRSEPPPSLRQSYGANGVMFHGRQHGLPPPGPYGYGMVDPSMGIGPIGGGGGRYYQNGSGQDGSGGSGSGNSSSSVNGMLEYDPYGQYK